MLLLLLILSLIAMVVFIVLSYYSNKKRERDWNYNIGLPEISFVFSWIFGIISLIFIIVICSLAPKVATENILDEKIAMYQEENAKIEEDIDQIVNTYLSHEKDTFAQLKTEQSKITLVTLYPELNSNELVKSQITIYTNNNACIKSLKSKKLDIAKTKWILYFGK